MKCCTGLTGGPVCFPATRSIGTREMSWSPATVPRYSAPALVTPRENTPLMLCVDQLGCPSSLSIHDGLRPQAHRAAATIAGEQQMFPVGRPAHHDVICRVRHQGDFAAPIDGEDKHVTLVAGVIRRQVVGQTPAVG